MRPDRINHHRNRSLRQVAEVDERSDIDLLLLEACLDLELLHLLQCIHVDAQTRLVIVVVHGQIYVGHHAHHAGVDQKLARLAGLLEVEPRRLFQVLEEGTNRDRILLQEGVLPHQDDQLLVERHAILRVEDLAHLDLAFRQRGKRLRQLTHVDLSGVERFLHRRKWDRQNRHIGLDEPVLLERRLQPQVPRGEKAVDADALALEVGHRFDGRALLDVETGAEAPRAFPRDRGDHRGSHAFRGTENDTIGAAGGEIDGACLEGLRPFVGSGEACALDGVSLTVVLGEVGLG